MARERSPFSLPSLEYAQAGVASQAPAQITRDFAGVASQAPAQYLAIVRSTSAAHAATPPLRLRTSAMPRSFRKRAASSERTPV
jgi:hypothetical protein